MRQPFGLQAAFLSFAQEDFFTFHLFQRPVRKGSRRQSGMETVRTCYRNCQKVHSRFSGQKVRKISAPSAFFCVNTDRKPIAAAAVACTAGAGCRAVLPFHLCTRPVALPVASVSISATVAGFMSPSTECFRQLAAAANRTASRAFFPFRRA